MRILVVSATCSAQKYQQVYYRRTMPMLDTNQKFFLSLIDGLRKQEGVQVDCVTTLPISYRCYPDRIVKQEEEAADGVFFHYCGCINLPIIRTLTVKSNIKAFVKRYIQKHRGEKIVVLCDGLIAEANALVKFLRKKRICAAALVTDIPDMVSDISTDKGLKSKLLNIYGKYATKLLQSFDKYVFLTEQMNELCNPEGNPYMRMECIVSPVDISKIESRTLSDKPVVLYAGKLHSDFGTLQLAEAAAYLQDTCEIWLYGGHGDCDEKLKELADKYGNIKLHGIVPLQEILAIEKNAQILINPRPDEKAFTKYSFPSKTAEYMMMQVPVVMHKLAGVPDQYDPYLYYIEENSPYGIAQKIKQVLAESEQEKQEKALSARNYIISKKNNVHQAKRMVDFFLSDGENSNAEN